MKTATNTFNNEKLNVRSVDQNDLDSLIQFLERNRDRLSTWAGWLECIRTEDQCKTFLQLMEGMRESGTSDIWGLWKDDALIGVSYIFDCEFKNRRASIAIMIDKDHRGSKLGYKFASNVIDFCFNVSGINRLEVRCLRVDDICNSFTKALGFQEEGKFKDSAWVNDQPQDEVQYSLLATDWNKAQTLLH